MPTVAAYTLGCKVNHYDTEAILRDFAALGFTQRQTGADVCLVNTCTVTNASDKKSRQTLSRARAPAAKRHPQRQNRKHAANSQH